MENLLMGMGTLAQSSGGGAGGAVAGGLFLVFFLFFALFSIACLAFWIWMLVDCARREFDGPNDKLIWILVIVLAGALGALIYLCAGRSRGRLV